MKSNGFELSSYSKAIQAEAIRIEGIERDTAALRQELVNNPSEELEEQIEDLEKSVDDADNELVVKIKKYDANRERYSQLGEKLKASREAKKQPKTVPVVDPAVPVVDPAASVVDPAPSTDPNQDTEPNKKGGSGWLLAGALLVFGSIIGVNLLKKK